MTPQEHLRRVLRETPRLPEYVEQILDGRGGELPDWPQWCFIPLSGWHSILSLDGPVPEERLDEVPRVAAIGAWRYTQGIYRFDDAVASALWRDELPPNLPCEAFHYLPQWSVYLETPGWRWGDQVMSGFWAFVEWVGPAQLGQLWLILNTADLIPLSIDLGGWPIMDAMREMWNAEALDPLTPPAGVLARLPGEHPNTVTPLVLQLLYLCSGKPEIEDERRSGAKPGNPKRMTTRMGAMLAVPTKSTVWLVGSQLGERIRRERG